MITAFRILYYVCQPMILAGLVLCLSPLVHCEEHKGTASGAAAVPPVIPPELEIRYLRAIVENQAAQIQARATEAKQKQVADEITVACGKDYIPQDMPTPDG